MIEPLTTRDELYWAARINIITSNLDLGFESVQPRWDGCQATLDLVHVFPGTASMSRNGRSTFTPDRVVAIPFDGAASGGTRTILALLAIVSHPLRKARRVTLHGYDLHFKLAAHLVDMVRPLGIELEILDQGDCRAIEVDWHD